MLTEFEDFFFSIYESLFLNLSFALLLQGVNMFQDIRLVQEDPHSVAVFLGLTSGLSKKQVGRFISHQSRYGFTLTTPHTRPPLTLTLQWPLATSLPSLFFSFLFICSSIFCFAFVFVGVWFVGVWFVPLSSEPAFLKSSSGCQTVGMYPWLKL